MRPSRLCMFIREERTAGTNIVNIDDPLGAALLASTKAAGGCALSYGFEPMADVCVVSSASEPLVARTRLQYRGKIYDLKTQLPGAPQRVECGGRIRVWSGSRN